MVNERDTHDIVVDLERWSSSRSSLTALIARALDLPASEIRPLLEEKPPRVASYAYAAEAARVAASLSAINVPVRVVAPSGDAGRTAAAQGAELARTMMPGWSALDEASDAPAELTTMMGLPSRLSELARGGAPAGASFAEGTPTGELRPSGRGGGMFNEADLDAWEALADAAVGGRRSQKDGAAVAASRSAGQGAAVSVRASRPAGASALEDDPTESALGDDRVPGIRGFTETAQHVVSTEADAPAGEAPASAAAPLARPPQDAGVGRASAEWSDILGSALKARLVGAEQGVIRSAPPMGRASSGSRAGAPGWESSRAEAARGEERALEAETMILPGGIPRPERSTERSTERIAGEGAGTGEGDVARPLPGGAWAHAGIDLEGAVLASASDDEDDALVQPSNRRAPAELSVDTGDTPSVAEQGAPWEASPLARAGASSEVSRLGTPSPGAPGRVVSVRSALLWGLAAPGGGQAYLGNWQRGVTYALSSPLVVPWLIGAAQARREARAGKEGVRLLERRPSASLALRFALVFWGCVLVVALVLNSALRFEPELSAGGNVYVPPAPAASEPLEGDSPAAASPGEEEPSEPESEAPSEAALAERLRVVLLDARRACQTERYRLCQELAEEALALDGRNREAQLLHVRAISEGVVEPPAPEPSSPTGYDRQPDRTLAPR